MVWLYCGIFFYKKWGQCTGTITVQVGILKGNLVLQKVSFSSNCWGFRRKSQLVLCDAVIWPQRGNFCFKVLTREWVLLTLYGLKIKADHLLGCAGVLGNAGKNEGRLASRGREVQHLLMPCTDLGLVADQVLHRN